jgi:hypothetical protein
MCLTFITLLLVSQEGLTKNPDLYVEKLQTNKKLKLADGRELILQRLFNDIGPSMRMRLFLRQNQKVIWDVTYNEDLGTLWADAHFLPLFDKTYMKDLDGDSNPEIAIQVWHGGNAMGGCRAIIFTVKQNKLVPIKTRQSNYEFARMVYSNEQEAVKSISDEIKSN